jgi:hypothetical protein
VKLHKKSLVLAASALAHGLLLGALLLAPSEPREMLDSGGAMGVLLVDGRTFAAGATPQRPAAAPAGHVKKRPLSDIEPEYVEDPEPQVEISDRDLLADPVALAVAAAGAKGQVCQLTTWLQQALQEDPQVRAALATMPRRARSLSNAFMLWDSDWVAGDPKAAASLAAVRAAVVAGIRAAPDGCLSAPVRGPELMTLTDEAGTTVIAIGSGEWRWQDLLTTAPAMRPTSEVLDRG